ncbi:MAG TPA: glutamine--fructose-6-phosphate aminotransferase, partial [bacterium]
MCGIVGYTGQKPAAPILLNGLIKLEYRGYDSAGLALVTPGRALKIIKKSGKIHNLVSAVRATKVPAVYTAGIGHTRWA